jgi:hypothetical protein
MRIICQKGINRIEKYTAIGNYDYFTNVYFTAKYLIINIIWSYTINERGPTIMVLLSMLLIPFRITIFRNRFFDFLVDNLCVLSYNCASLQAIFLHGKVFI